MQVLERMDPWTYGCHYFVWPRVCYTTAVWGSARYHQDSTPRKSWPPKVPRSTGTDGEWL